MALLILLLACILVAYLVGVDVGVTTERRRQEDERRSNVTVFGKTEKTYLMRDDEEA